MCISDVLAILECGSAEQENCIGTSYFQAQITTEICMTIVITKGQWGQPRARRLPVVDVASNNYNVSHGAAFCFYSKN